MNNCVDFQVAKQQLDEMGPISDDEKVFLFVMLGILQWFAQKLHVGDVGETETVERNRGRNRDNRPFGDFKLWKVTNYISLLVFRILQTDLICFYGNSHSLLWTLLDLYELMCDSEGMVAMWASTSLIHSISPAVTAFCGLGLLLLTGVITWEDDGFPM